VKCILTPEQSVYTARASRVVRLIERHGQIDGALALSYVVWPDGPPHPRLITRAVRKYRPSGEQTRRAA
jgi:hypothetical protein